MSNILVIASHPDDEVLGCGITIQNHIAQGDDVFILIMTHNNKRYLDASQLSKDILHAHEILQSTDYKWHTFPIQELDSIPLIKLIKLIEKQIRDWEIDVVYTHHYGDINKDHRLVYEATITACRPTVDCKIKQLLSYWVPSSSEWMNYDENSAFKPNFVVEATEKQVEIKIDSMLAYASEVKKWPHPRSSKGIKAYAEIFGSQFGMKYAEPFQLLYHRKFQHVK